MTGCVVESAIDEYSVDWGGEVMDRFWPRFFVPWWYLLSIKRGKTRLKTNVC